MKRNVEKRVKKQKIEVEIRWSAVQKRKQKQRMRRGRDSAPLRFASTLIYKKM